MLARNSRIRAVKYFRSRNIVKLQFSEFYYQTAHPCRQFIFVIYLFSTEMDIACRHVTLDHSQTNPRTCPRERLLTSPRFGDGTRLWCAAYSPIRQICIYFNFSCWQHLRNMHESENRMKVFLFWLEELFAINRRCDNILRPTRQSSNMFWHVRGAFFQSRLHLFSFVAIWIDIFDLTIYNRVCVCLSVRAVHL